MGAGEGSEGRVSWRGGETWYRLLGDAGRGATPLLCLHGGPGSTHNYFARLEALAEERAIVLYDQVGCGRSAKAADAAWGIPLFLEELRALRAHLALGDVHVLGSSWGGMLALEHALDHGGVRSLVLSSTLASVDEWTYEVRRLRDALPPDVVATLDRHEAAGTLDDPEYRRALDAFDAAYVYRGAIGTPELERMRAERSPDAYGAMWGPNEWTVTGELAGWDVRVRLAEIDVPCLVARGRYDLCTEGVAATLLAGLRDARLVVLDDSSHMPALEETERYVAAVGTFLRAVEGA